MDFKVEELGPCLKKIAITVSPDKVREEYDGQFKEINDSIVFPGFRKGHAPKKLLEKRFGETMGQDVKEKLVKGAIEELIEDKKLDPIEPPKIDLEELVVDPEKAFEFEFEVLTKPEFETPGFKGLEIEVPPVKVSDEDIQNAIDSLLQRQAKLELVEDADAEVGEKDVLVLDWQAKDGDSIVAQDNGAYYLFGRGVLASFVTESLDEALLGKKVGATAQLKVQAAADDPREELREKELDLDVTLKEIRRHALPKIDAAFLKKHDYDDEAEMREDARKQLERMALRDRDQRTEVRLLDRLTEGVKISLPEEYVERELANWTRRLRDRLTLEKMPEDEIQKRLDAERQDATAAVEKDLRRYFLLDRIADEEDIRVAEKELLQAIQEIAQAYGRSEQEVLTSYRDGGRLADLSNQIRHRKTQETILRAAKLVEKEGADAPPSQE